MAFMAAPCNHCFGRRLRRREICVLCVRLDFGARASALAYVVNRSLSAFKEDHTA